MPHLRHVLVDHCNRCLGLCLAPQQHRSTPHATPASKLPTASWIISAYVVLLLQHHLLKATSLGPFRKSSMADVVLCSAWVPHPTIQSEISSTYHSYHLSAVFAVLVSVPCSDQKLAVGPGYEASCSAYISKECHCFHPQQSYSLQTAIHPCYGYIMAQFSVSIHCHCCNTTYTRPHRCTLGRIHAVSL